MTEEVPLAKAYGNVVFCDDIRVEEGGKFSFMGVYTNAIIVHSEFPVTLPKFGIFITYIEQYGQMEGDLSLRVYLPGDPDDKPSMVGDTIPASFREFTKLPDPDSEFPIDKPVKQYRSPLLLAPFTLRQKGFIKVRALVGNELVRLGAIKVDQALPAQPSPPEGSKQKNK